MYRASARKWAHPKEAIPSGSTPEPSGGSGAMRSPMTRDKAAGLVWTARLDVPEKLAPLHLGFSLYQPGAAGGCRSLITNAVAGWWLGQHIYVCVVRLDRAHRNEAMATGTAPPPRARGVRETLIRHAQALSTRTGSFHAGVPRRSMSRVSFAADREFYDIPLRAAHFCVPIGMSAGVPEPMGASVVAVEAARGGPREALCAVNFSVSMRVDSARCMRIRPAYVGVPVVMPACSAPSLAGLGDLGAGCRQGDLTLLHCTALHRVSWLPQVFSRHASALQLCLVRVQAANAQQHGAQPAALQVRVRIRGMCAVQ